MSMVWVAVAWEGGQTASEPQQPDEPHCRHYVLLTIPLPTGPALRPAVLPQRTVCQARHEDSDGPPGLARTAVQQ